MRVTEVIHLSNTICTWNKMPSSVQHLIIYYLLRYSTAVFIIKRSFRFISSTFSTNQPGTIYNFIAIPSQYSIAYFYLCRILECKNWRKWSNGCSKAQSNLELQCQHKSATLSTTQNIVNDAVDLPNERVISHDRKLEAERLPSPKRSNRFQYFRQNLCIHFGNKKFRYFTRRSDLSIICPTVHQNGRKFWERFWGWKCCGLVCKSRSSHLRPGSLRQGRRSVYRIHSNLFAIFAENARCESIACEMLRRERFEAHHGISLLHGNERWQHQNDIWSANERCYCVIFETMSVG